MTATSSDQAEILRRRTEALRRLALALGAAEAEAVGDRYAGRRRIVQMLREESEVVAESFPPRAAPFTGFSLIITGGALVDRLEQLAAVAEAVAHLWEEGPGAS